MDQIEKRYYISWLREKYHRRKRSEKSKILDDLEERFGLNRKSCIRLMRRQEVGRPRKAETRGRPGKYRDVDFKKSLVKVWRICGCICSKRLKEALPDWLDFIEKEYGNFSEEIRTKLLEISSATMERILKPYKKSFGRSLTKNGGFRDKIPIGKNLWETKLPGCLEVDTVAHCGGSMEGEFINSLTAVDIASLWTEVNSVYGRGSTATFASLRQIESELPFLITAYDSDNGGEVLNELVYDYFTKERVEQGLPVVSVTRARAYQKNDSAHVEQRNNAIARKYLGYERLGFRELQVLVSQYYRQIVCPLINHFLPSFKLKAKLRKASKTVRVYGKPITPYRRLLESGQLPDEFIHKLKKWHEEMNPVLLMKQEKETRNKIFKSLEKLKKGIKLNEKDLSLPQGTVIRPIFKESFSAEVKLRMSSEQYALSRQASQQKR